jgi:hypothetical protein
MTVAEIVDKVLPITKEDQRCGMMKAKKLKARNELILLINDYKEGKPVTLPFEVFKMLNKEI